MFWSPDISPELPRSRWALPMSSSFSAMLARPTVSSGHRWKCRPGSDSSSFAGRSAQFDGHCPAGPCRSPGTATARAEAEHHEYADDRAEAAAAGSARFSRSWPWRMMSPEIGAPCGPVGPAPMVRRRCRRRRPIAAAATAALIVPGHECPFGLFVPAARPRPSAPLPWLFYRYAPLRFQRVTEAKLAATRAGRQFIHHARFVGVRKPHSVAAWLMRSPVGTSSLPTSRQTAGSIWKCASPSISASTGDAGDRRSAAPSPVDLAAADHASRRRRPCSASTRQRQRLLQRAGRLDAPRESPVARDDDVQPPRQRLPMLEGLAAHDDRLAHRARLGALQVAGQPPRQPVAAADHAVCGDRRHGDGDDASATPPRRGVRERQLLAMPAGSAEIGGAVRRVPRSSRNWRAAAPRRSSPDKVVGRHLEGVGPTFLTLSPQNEDEVPRVAARRGWSA